MKVHIVMISFEGEGFSIEKVFSEEEEAARYVNARPVADGKKWIIREMEVDAKPDRSKIRQLIE